ncbi:hypothetical protein PIIN_11451 [Serendipita indica DSM 11827]|uniref:Uncharacterized protein n=1 Tax=Serendipita indica (strain DSM 11827) TaxID=1109443 RepID=G4U1N1_SERID|nr:hypothetical protein PIIN_11451 [Serendipita indica DSM 11827]
MAGVYKSMSRQVEADVLE